MLDQQRRQKAMLQVVFHLFYEFKDLLDQPLREEWIPMLDLLWLTEDPLSLLLREIDPNKLRKLAKSTEAFTLDQSEGLLLYSPSTQSKKSRFLNILNLVWRLYGK